MSKRFPRKKPYWNLNVIKITKSDFINPINIPRPDVWLWLLSTSFLPGSPFSLRERRVHLATFWVNFITASSKSSGYINCFSRSFLNHPTPIFCMHKLPATSRQQELYPFDYFIILLFSLFRGNFKVAMFLIFQKC